MKNNDALIHVEKAHFTLLIELLSISQKSEMLPPAEISFERFEFHPRLVRPG